MGSVTMSSNLDTSPSNIHPEGEETANRDCSADELSGGGDCTSVISEAHDTSCQQTLKGSLNLTEADTLMEDSVQTKGSYPDYVKARTADAAKTWTEISSMKRDLRHLPLPQKVTLVTSIQQSLIHDQYITPISPDFVGWLFNQHELRTVSRAPKGDFSLLSSAVEALISCLPDVETLSGIFSSDINDEGQIFGHAAWQSSLDPQRDLYNLACRREREEEGAMSGVSNGIVTVPSLHELVDYAKLSRLDEQRISTLVDAVKRLPSLPALHPVKTRCTPCRNTLMLDNSTEGDTDDDP